MCSTSPPFLPRRIPSPTSLQPSQGPFHLLPCCAVCPFVHCFISWCCSDLDCVCCSAALKNPSLRQPVGSAQLRIHSPQEASRASVHECRRPASQSWLAIRHPSHYNRTLLPSPSGTAAVQAESPHATLHNQRLAFQCRLHRRAFLPEPIASLVRLTSNTTFGCLSCASLIFCPFLPSWSLVLSQSLAPSLRLRRRCTMPYNTRRKSLSLPSLGIQLPGGPRSARSPPSTSDGQHVAKKQKRSHSGSSASSPTSLPRPTTLRFDEQRPKSAGRAADTPPPSPGGESGSTKVDTQGIDDEIVVGVIEQLEKTGNRPHLLKELATVLSPTIPIVERYVPNSALQSLASLLLMLTCHSSANPAAIISSRLATYLKRSWTALSRCPLDKKLVGTHPKRVYYFLSTCPHQPIPTDAGNASAAARIISPSLSSAASEEEDLDARSRARMSPSPELDLSDYDSNASDPFSNQSHPPTTANIANNRRAQSPPLEKDEREFTQTASFLQQRRKSQEAERVHSTTVLVEHVQKDVIMDEVSHSIEETEESAARMNSEAAAALFGHMDHLSSFQANIAPSSPALKPTLHIDMPPPSLKRKQVRLDVDDDDWTMKSPESIDLDELDDLFGGY